MIYINPKTKLKPLKKGDTFIVVAASSAIAKESKIIAGKRILESWGLICIHETNIIERRWGYLAGNDYIRHKELHHKEKASLTIFARGGWGSARLLEKECPWVEGFLLGYSDLTSILLSRLKDGFDGNIHGPLLTSIYDEPEWSRERLRKLLFGENLTDLKGEGWSGGTAKGPILVANLTVASHLIGTKHMPNLQGSILIFEDIGEAPYRIDRMLTQWRLSGLLYKLAGIGFGSFINCDDPEEDDDEEGFTTKQVLKERIKDLNIPAVGELPIGHCKGNAAIKLGSLAKIDGDIGTLSFRI